MKFSHYAFRTTLGRGLSTLTCHGNGVFRTRSSNRRNLKTSYLRFSVNGIHFEIGAFGERWRHDTFFTWFPWPSFSKRRIQNNRRYFSGVVWAGYNEVVPQHKRLCTCSASQISFGTLLCSVLDARQLWIWILWQTCSYLLSMEHFDIRTKLIESYYADRNESN